MKKVRDAFYMQAMQNVTKQSQVLTIRMSDGALHVNKSQIRTVGVYFKGINAFKWLKISPARTNYNVFSQCDNRYGKEMSYSNKKSNFFLL